ncbi:MAG: hypothetical protein IJT98_03470 [Prevotella sp.]|nr:hypothetical protein [Prevotella sp.]
MKSVLRLFALMTVFFMGSMGSADAATKLKYDFVTKHPAANIRIDDGFREVRGSYAYWSGTWAGLFGNKIAFATDSYPVLRSVGGLVDYHSSRKMYLMNLSVGDQLAIYYGGDNPNVQFHNSASARLTGVTTQYQQLMSGTYYTVSTAGNLALLTRYVSGEATTVIDSIVIMSVKDYETVDVSHGMCTFCSTVPLDFSQSSTLKAYVATKFDNGRFTFREVSYVPSDTGFLIVAQGGTASSATVPVGRSDNYRENAIATNLFEGCLSSGARIVVPSGNAAYMFGVADGKVGIFRTASAFTSLPNKAYLIVNE